LTLCPPSAHVHFTVSPAVIWIWSGANSPSSTVTFEVAAPAGAASPSESAAAASAAARSFLMYFLPCDDKTLAGVMPVVAPRRPRRFVHQTFLWAA
jgi:hypothetical protein